MDLTVVVCVSNDFRVVKTLGSIDESCEVIVVLNGPSLELERVVLQYVPTIGVSVRVIQIPERNLSKARDIGTTEARYDKVVHIDSDCVLAPGGLRDFHDYLDTYSLVDGGVKFLDDGFQSCCVGIIRSLGVPGYALCPGIGIHKRMLPVLEGYYFNPQIMWIEDADLNRRAIAAGIEIGFIKKIVCYHAPITFRHDLRSAFRYGVGRRRSCELGLVKKKSNANWWLIPAVLRKSVIAALYFVVWNCVYVAGYLLANTKTGTKKI